MDEVTLPKVIAKIIIDVFICAADQEFYIGIETVSQQVCDIDIDPLKLAVFFP